MKLTPLREEDYQRDCSQPAVNDSCGSSYIEGVFAHDTSLGTDILRIVTCGSAVSFGRV